MILIRLFKRIRFFLARLIKKEGVESIILFVADVRAIVENPATADLALLTPSKKDDKVIAKIKDVFTHVDIFEETVQKAKEKEDVDLVAYFIDRVRNTKKNRRAGIYLALASELLRKLNEKYSHSEADTLVQLAITKQKYAL